MKRLLLCCSEFCLHRNEISDNRDDNCNNIDNDDDGNSNEDCDEGFNNYKNNDCSLHYKLLPIRYDIIRSPSNNCR